MCLSHGRPLAPEVRHALKQPTKFYSGADGIISLKLSHSGPPQRIGEINALSDEKSAM